MLKNNFFKFFLIKDSPYHPNITQHLRMRAFEQLAQKTPNYQRIERPLINERPHKQSIEFIVREKKNKYNKTC